jgi:hypothetical protein
MITKELQNMRPLKGDQRFERDSEYMGADDITQNTEPVLTIKNIYRGKVTLSRGKEVKNVLTFVEETVPGMITEVRPMIVNSGNRQTLKKLFGQVTATALEGKKIQLYIEHGVRNPSTGELTDGIRIRDKKPAAGGKTAAAPKCAECGKEIIGVSGFSTEQIVAASKKKYGKALCVDCGQKAKAALEAKEAEAKAALEAKEAEAKAALEAKEAEAKTEEPHDDLAAQLMADAGE